MNYVMRNLLPRTVALFLLLLILVLTMASCSSSPEDDPISIVGTIKLDRKSGSLTIESVGGTVYCPMNLPASFQKAGLAVRTEAKIRRDVAGIKSKGLFIEIIKIELWK